MTITNIIDGIFQNKIKDFNLEEYNLNEDYSRVYPDNKIDLFLKYQEPLENNENKINNIKNKLNNKIDTIQKLNEILSNQKITIKTNKKMNTILNNVTQKQQQNNRELKQDLSLNKDNISTINEKYIEENKKKDKYIKQIKILSIILIVLIIVYLFLL